MEGFSDSGLVLERSVPFRQEDLDLLDRIYSHARDAIEALNTHPRIIPVVSFEQVASDVASQEDAYLEDTGDQQMQGRRGRDFNFSKALDFQINRDRSRFFCRQIEDLSSSVSKLSPELFAAFWREQAVSEQFVLNMTKGKTSLFSADALPDSTSLLETMGLGSISAGEYLSGSWPARQSFPYTYFKDYEEYDRVFGEFSSGFDDYANAMLTLKFHDPARFSAGHSFWRSWLEMRALMALSSQGSANIGIVGDSPSTYGRYKLAKDDDRLQLFSLYVRDVCPVPQIENIADLLRLHEHKFLRNFKAQLEQWRWALLKGDAHAVIRMKKDFELAKRDLQRIAKIANIGSLMTIIALPVAIGGLLSGLPLDFGFTVLGPGLVAYSKRLEQSACWVKFGDVD